MSSLTDYSCEKGYLCGLKSFQAKPLFLILELTDFILKMPIYYVNSSKVLPVQT